MADLFGANSIFRTGSGPAQTVRSGEPAASAEPALRQQTLANEVSGLKAGDTFKAQVVERNDSQVTLRLSDDSVIHASIGKGIPAAVGDTLTFEVRSNQSTLSLSPLYTNTASDPTALRALDMAGIAPSEKAVSMTSSMMQAGMSIDRGSLLQMFSSVNAHPNASVQDVVDLTRLGIPVNDRNLAQISDYKNLSYELGEGMREVADKMGETILSLVESGDTVKAGEVLLSLAKLSEGAIPEDLEAAIAAIRTEEEGAAAEGGQADARALGPDAGTLTNLSESLKGETDPAAAKEARTDAPAGADNARAAVEAPLSAAQKALELLKAMQGGTAEDPKVTAAGGEAKAQNGGSNDAATLEATAKTADGASVIASDAGKVLIRDAGAADQSGNAAASARLENAGYEDLARALSNDLRGAEKVLLGLSESLRENAAGTDAPMQVSDLMNAFRQVLGKALSEKDMGTLKTLLQDPALRDLTTDLLKAQWSISPKEVSEKEKVEDLYRRLNTQLERITETLDKQNLTQTPAFQSSSNMQQNLDFLQQVNQMYAYVQLPIRLSGGDTAHGDLYVYTNGKKLTGKESSVSALLHLDMEHLGPLDVYVALDRSGPQQKVSTQFYVQDDSILDFLAEHMDELNARLESRGYACSCKMHVRGEKDEDDGLPEGGIAPLLISQAHLRGGEISFDVRT
ncbi:MAG: flagellar hook-length control protein FliK [Lachnospiraceae bacterium]|nr:flagellar hook-length control protein FliK [Lachnospiraceae bacterium]